MAEEFAANQLASTNPYLKNQLKLDFTTLKDIKAAAKGKQLDLDPQNPVQNLGFHEEFMSRLDEFSLSWREAAMNERKIP